MKFDHLKWVSVLVLCLNLLACKKDAPPSNSSLASFRIVGYEPTWVGPHAIRYDRLTHLNYAFLMANSDGSLVTTGMNLPRMQTFIADAHRAGVKVSISLGGAANTQLSLAAVKARAELIANVKAFIDQYGFDGVDIDWEGPANLAEGNAYLELARSLYNDLHPLGKLVTTAVGTWFGQNIPNGSFEFLDFVNIMSYDGDGLDHSPYSLAESDLKFWLGKGLPKSKAVIGVPFYGYDAVGRPSYTETAYKDIIAKDSSAANQDFSNGVGYNGIPTIKRKTQLAIDSASGVMIWQISEDTSNETSLLSAIHDVLSTRR
jgi:chitinase